MQGLGSRALAVGRLGLAVATAGLALTGVLVAVTAPGDADPVGRTVTAAAAVGCAASGAYHPPGPGSVGVPPGLRLCPSGSVTVTAADTVLDGLDVTGGIVVDAPGVVVRRSRITGNGSTPYGVSTTSAGSVRIEDTTITGAFSEAGIGDDAWTAERVEITRVSGDGARLGSRATLRNSRLHDLVPAAGRSTAALRLVAPGGDVLVENNRIEMGRGPGHDSAVLLAPAQRGRGETAGEGAVVIRGNLLGGGEYTLRQVPVSGGAVPDVRITGNQFRRDALAGPLQVPATSLLADNVFVDGGAVSGRG
ncbi:hypothetical protein ACVGVM_09525 [Pseudonocardia bannensis]|uniref:Right-handed parallel beta-helix repeat-containing protein n=1 Tax=Pseudonocardia bannensis TaxID=630973 RepID=A0A848DGG1_9PSEU|nr:right-handed parallel beta-helix repeat-containing protein [Pseudonocardia bannensis]NMH91611.1 right-handed parallel beta-helix repeat-containing protein [Pseudonocardia bannensis]